MSETASPEELNGLHSEVCKALTVEIKKVHTDAQGNQLRSASMLGQAIKFLKDNNIQATEKKKELADLVDSLPTFADDIPFGATTGPAH